jgi:hypothetical protein
VWNKFLGKACWREQAASHMLPCAILVKGVVEQNVHSFYRVVDYEIVLKVALVEKQ